MAHHNDHDENGPGNFWGSRFGIGLLVLGGIAGYFLWSEHQAHVIQALPYLLLLACPLMHMFMHGGHHHHHGGDEQKDKDNKKSGGSS